jgi:heat shock protein HtpX
MAASGSGPSLKGRFAAAIALTIGFYTLALAIAAALLGVAILPWALGDGGNVWLSISGLVAGGTILVAIFPRRLPFDPPGVRLTDSEQPRLMALIADEARACGERPPDEVYATFAVNAAVREVGRHRRVMILGLPLLHLVTERGLRSVIAHELGHYAGGDTRLGPWIYRTRDAIERTIARLSDDDDSWTKAIVRQPFIWYGKAFLRVTNAIKRRQEFAADALAARRAGREVHTETLRRTHSYGPAFDAYWVNEVVPVLEAGRRPPVGDGFTAFIHSEAVERAAAAQLDHELSERVTHPYSSHPSLLERIAAVQDVPAGAPDDSPPATALVRDPAALEAAQTAYLIGDAAVAALPPIEWDAVGEVYLERARDQVSEHGELLGTATAGGLDVLVDDLGRLAGRLGQREPDLPADHAHDYAAALIANGLLVALDGDGWSVEAPPAEPVICRRGDDRVAPHIVVAELRGGSLSAEAWHERVAALGISDLALHAEGAAA